MPRLQFSVMLDYTLCATQRVGQLSYTIPCCSLRCNCWLFTSRGLHSKPCVCMCTQCLTAHLQTDTSASGRNTHSRAFSTSGVHDRADAVLLSQGAPCSAAHLSKCSTAKIGGHVVKKRAVPDFECRTSLPHTLRNVSTE